MERVSAGFSAAADCRSSLECVAQLGATIEMIAENGATSGARAALTGGGQGGYYGGRACGAAARQADLSTRGTRGTTMRLMAGVLAGQRLLTRTLTGDGSLRRRPMRRVMAPLGRWVPDRCARPTILRAGDWWCGAAGD